jgi:hypothetical protein
VFNVRRIIAPPEVRTISAARELRRFGRFRVLEVDGPGFLELVDVPYWMNVPKRNLSRVQRSWLRSHLPAEGLHPAIRLLEEGAMIEGAVLADGVDVRFPEPATAAEARGEVVEVTRRGDDFRASVAAERPCHLLLKMSFHPGWRATVDGAPAETVQLMPSYVGVPLEAGAHEVELRWEPGSRKATLAGAGLAILIGFGVMERRFRR